jgi:signal transduction histidine kinase/ligand-binding sensor domain-containing protein
LTPHARPGYFPAIERVICAAPLDLIPAQQVRQGFYMVRGRSNRVRSVRLLLCALLLVCLRPAPPAAEQLPIKLYTATDGLARDRVVRVRQDSRGLLWLCTSEGLSRFDGHDFVNYTTDQGLPNRAVWDFLETSGGVYWVATLGGLARFNPTHRPGSRPAPGDAQPAPGDAQSEPMFVVYRPAEQPVNMFGALLEDRRGEVWWGTKGALYRVRRDGEGWKLETVDIGLPAEKPEIFNLYEDRQGALWIERFTTADGLPSDIIRGLWQDADGAMWVGTSEGLVMLEPDAHPKQSGQAGGSVVARYLGGKDGLPQKYVNWILRDSAGRLWVCTADGLSEMLPEPDSRGRHFRTYTNFNGLGSRFVWSAAEDRDGNLWLTSQAGVMKLAGNGFSTWRQGDGLGLNPVIAVTESRVGELVVTTSTFYGRYLSRWDGEQFTTVQPRFGRPLGDYGEEVHAGAIEDSAGEWWVPTGQGLFRFPRVARVEDLARTPPKQVFTTRDGLGTDRVFRVYEDRRGDVWIFANGLFRWERATGKLMRIKEAPEVFERAASAFAEDGAGNLWIAFYSGHLLRYRDGRFESWPVATGQYFRRINSLYSDRAGRLWVGTGENGLLRIDDPQAAQITFKRYTTADGLASNDIMGIAEDRFGNLWFGTGRGLDRLNAQTEQVKHFTTADGLASNVVQTVYADRHGALWLGTILGLSRYVPQPDPPVRPPPVYIRGLSVAGEAWPLAGIGELQVVGPQSLSADQNQVQIDFFGLGWGVGESLRYQYRLTGAGAWSEPIAQRSVNLTLAPGGYRFEVRAVSANGAVSDPPARVTLRILPPIWKRWWFIALAVALLGLAGHGAYRYRVAQLIALERVRTRIATDLHDDIGASLSRMAILSEVVKRQNGHDREQSERMLTEIAESARGLVDSMSDIVWSIDPRKDDLKNVVQRVRQFASDVLEAQGIAWDFKVAPDIEREGGVKLDPEQRRHVYLILKEALNNIARHAGCTAVALSFRIEGNKLRAEIHDNGRGFDVAAASAARQGSRGGNGLVNMRARAEQLGGRLDVDSVPGEGTRLSLAVPMRK